MPKLCPGDWSLVIIVALICGAALKGYYIFLDHQLKMLNQAPEKKNKITVKILAAGFAMAYGAMLLPTSRETLDFQIYSLHIELYAIVRVIIFLGMIVFGLITGGTYLSNFKGK